MKKENQKFKRFIQRLKRLRRKSKFLKASKTLIKSDLSESTDLLMLIKIQIKIIDSLRALDDIRLNFLNFIYKIMFEKSIEAPTKTPINELRIKIIIPETHYYLDAKADKKIELIHSVIGDSNESNNDNNKIKKDCVNSNPLDLYLTKNSSKELILSRKTDSPESQQNTLDHNTTSVTNKPRNLGFSDKLGNGNKGT